MATTDEELLNSEDNFEQDTATDTGAPADSNTDVGDGGTSSTPPVADSTITSAPASSYWDTAEAEKVPYYSYMKGFEEHNPLESEEAYQKRLRRARNAAIIGAIGEGISSLANLYATTKGAPNAQQVQLSAPMVKRYEDMEKERAANKKAWYEGYQKAVAADEANAKDERNWRLQFEKERASNDRANQQSRMAQEKAAREAEENEYNKSRRPLTERMEEAKVQEAETKAKYAEQTAKATLAHLNAQTAKAGQSGSGSSSKGYHFFGKSFGNSAEYSAGVKDIATILGVATTETTTKVDKSGNTTTSTKERKVDDIAAETKQAADKLIEDLRSSNEDTKKKAQQKIDELRRKRNIDLVAWANRDRNTGTSPTPSSPADTGDTNRSSVKGSGSMTTPK